MIRVLLALLALLAAAPPAHAAPARDVMAPAVVRAPGSPVGVLLQRAEPGRVTSFGQAFRIGDWPRGHHLTARNGARPVALQADIKARHADGSVRHAVISVVNPGGDGQIALIPVPGPAPATAPVTLQSALDRGYDVRFVLTIDGREGVVSAGRLLAAALADGPDYWMRGSLATEARAVRRITPEMTMILDIRVQSDGAVRTAYALHNDAMTGAPDLRYHITAAMGGQVFLDREITHRRHASWSGSVWAGAAPSSAHVVHDGPYLMAAGAVPPYDPELRVERDVFNRSAEKIARVDTGPLGEALIEKAMPSTGGRDDIGAIPFWSLAWLRTQGAEAKAAMLITANAASSVPWALRDMRTGLAPTLDDHPRYWADKRSEREGLPNAAIDFNVDGWQPDRAHQPELTAVPYLITGDRRYLDALHAQLAWGLLSYNPNYREDALGALTNAQVRAQAWVNRAHGHAAFLTPDDHPHKRYLTEKLTARLAWYAPHYRSTPRGGRPDQETFGWISGAAPTGEVAPWQQDMFAMTLGQIALQGETAANGLWRDLMRAHMTGRFLRSDWNPRWSTAYYLIYGPTREKPFSTWPEIAQANIAKGKIEQSPAEQASRPHAAWSYIANARAGMAMAVSGFRDPAAAEAYAYLVGASTAMHTGGDGFGRRPEWSIVPMFDDGATLAIANSRAGTERADTFEGSSAHELYAALGGDDRLDGGPGNDILSGWDGNDIIAGGPGINYLTGGRGDDRIVSMGVHDRISGGPGRDTFEFTTNAGITEVWDFSPGEDRLALPGQARMATGGFMIGQRQVILRGVPANLLPRLLASR